VFINYSHAKRLRHIAAGQPRTICHIFAPNHRRGPDAYETGHLILGTYGGDPDARPQVTIAGVDPPGEERVLIDYAELIEVVAYPPSAP